MARRATIIDSLRAHSKSHALVDLGDFMSNKSVVGAFESRFIWKTMEQMGYLASTPGVRELNEWILYRELVAASPIRSIATNLTVVENGVSSPAGVETFVTELGGVDVGFFSVIGGNELSTVKPPEGIEFEHENPIKTAERIVPELRKQAEVVVLMSQITPQETSFLTQQIPGIDVALCGRRPSWKDRAVMDGSTIVQQTGSRGQFLGELVLIIDPAGRIVDWGSRNRVLATDIPENAEIAAEVEKIRAEAKGLVKEKQREKTTELKDKLSSERYIGVDKCRRCHETEYRQWSGTDHAQAWKTLVDEGKESDKECAGCHVTGWQEPNEFVEDATMRNLVNVQCESCHGVGTRHARGGRAAEVTEKACRRCHQGKWAKEFDYATYLARIDHSHR